MTLKIEPEPKDYLLRVLIDHTGKEECLRMEDCPNEYRVVSVPGANAGIVIYARYGDRWVVNPWNTRHLVVALMN